MTNNKSVDNEVLLNAIKNVEKSVEKVETSVKEVKDKVDEIVEKQINDFHEIKRLNEKQQELEDRDSCPAIHMHTDSCLALAKANQKALSIKDSDTAIPIPSALAKKELIPWSAILKFAAILTPIAGAITVAVMAT